MVITWKNIAAPNLGGVSDMTARAGNAFTGALDSLQGIAADQTKMNIFNEKEAEKADNKLTSDNTQLALEAVEGIKNIEEYNNTSMDQLIGKFGDKINRQKVFNAFTQRDDDIWSAEAATEQREDKKLLRESTGLIDNFISEGKLGNKPEGQLKDGFEAMIADYPAHIKAQLRTKFTEQLEWENKLTPQEQAQYDVNAKRVQREYDLIDINTTEQIQTQQAIIQRDPNNRINEEDAQLSTAEYINKYAPDTFEASWSNWEGDDFEVLQDSDFIKGALKEAKNISGKTFTSVPDRIVDYVLKTSIRTSGDVPEIRLGSESDVQERIAKALIEFDAYDKNAAAAKKNISILERQRTDAANKLDKGLLDIRNSFTSRNSLLGK